MICNKDIHDDTTIFLEEIESELGPDTDEVVRLLVENADAALSFSELHLRSGVDLPHLQEAARHLVVLKKAKVVPGLMIYFIRILFS